MNVRGQLIRQLAAVEGELRASDETETQLGDMADTMGAKLDGELARRRKALRPWGNDAQAEDEYLYLVEQRHRAAQVGELAEREAVRSGEASDDEVPDVQNDAD